MRGFSYGLLGVGLHLASWALAAAPASNPAGGTDRTLIDFQQALRTLDQATIERLIAATNPDEALQHTPLAAACAAVGAFEVAMKDRFGRAADGKWGIGPDDASVRVTLAGETATTTPAAGPPAVVVLIRRQGQWRLTTAGVAIVLKARGVEPAVPPDEPLRRLTDMAEVLRHVATGVKNGDYPTPDAAADAARGAWTDAAAGRQAQ